MMPTSERYRIRGLLGEAGMARIDVAQQSGIEGFAKIVALKRLLPHLATSAPFRTLFLNEARVAARLDHPNIVATYELGELEDTYFMAMEYLPGEDLGAILARCEAPQPMPVEIAAFLAQQCANGLHHAHEMHDPMGAPAGVVHRQVNPSNVFVTYHGMVKLLGFAHVRIAGAGPSRPTTRAFRSKFAYCSPEQVQLAADGRVDHRTDIFSLGIVLWECLTGHRLFDSPTDGGAIEAVRSQAIPPPSLLRPEVPLGLDDITLRALERDPDRRYPNAHDLSDALDGLLYAEHRRPSASTVGQWLESLFGTERAGLKRAIVQGNDLESALAKLGNVEAAPANGGEPARPAGGLASLLPRPLWSTGLDPRGTNGSGTAAPADVASAGENAAGTTTPLKRLLAAFTSKLGRRGKE